MLPHSDDVRALSSGPIAVWLGHGARRASDAILRFVEHTGAIVMSTPHGKGIFPEDHPQFAGVTGFGGHDSVTQMIEAVRPSTVLVLGSRLGEFSSIWDPRLLPGHVIHVDSDDAAFHVGYPDVAVTSVVADVGSFCEAMLRMAATRARIDADVARRWTRASRSPDAHPAA